MDPNSVAAQIASRLFDSPTLEDIQEINTMLCDSATRRGFADAMTRTVNGLGRVNQTVQG